MGNTKSSLKSKVLSCFYKKRTPKPNESQQPEILEQYELLNLEGNLRNPKTTYHLSNHCYDDIDRQYFNHFFRRHMFQSSFSAPIEKKLIEGGCKVLDVGCGPGAWLIDLANKYEDSNFFGIDIKSVYPSEAIPENLEFVEADIFNGLPFPDDEFDFVHQEVMGLIIKAIQWDFVISELVRVTKPGSFIELVEYISPEKNGPVMSELYRTHAKICLERGVDTSLTSNLDELMSSQRNISQVNKDKRTFIIGPNGGKIGSTILDILTTFITSDIAIEEITEYQGVTKEEYMKKFTKLKKELRNTRPMLTICRFWARKDLNI
ncbi:uncharacterized protein OCT59_009619 [Rhizophagus irregularis]|uniref:uncharacterized protein n=1 Tax=Rhizophagus irregularis TaxID=588596 RepID=UPI000CBBD19F|nr:hypothetical protein OCT59_009619 [Rhizophagus irregularis]GBC25183.1 S-adenosyl-L-methionine-dependent methyltransferase [Rhizophagus irregularis DAOM 181602=DAOM 197198]CAG8636302.1 358_t:CDS:2 [Rhizophagus irregularis]